jgi:hypothetical protein
MAILPTPELEAAKLYRRLIKARRDTEAAEATLAQSTSEAADARAHLSALEAEYRAVKRECVA